jgi:hypothetical protein
MSIFFLKKSTLLKDLFKIALILKMDGIRLSLSNSECKQS